MTDQNNVCNDAMQGNTKLPFQLDLPITWFEYGRNNIGSTKDLNK